MATDKLLVPPAKKPVAVFEYLRFKYCLRPDRLFPGIWRVEPMKYVGIGFVYLFRVEAEARAWTKHKNLEFTE